MNVTASISSVLDRKNRIKSEDTQHEIKNELGFNGNIYEPSLKRAFLQKGVGLFFSTEAVRNAIAGTYTRVIADSSRLVCEDRHSGIPLPSYNPIIDSTQAIDYGISKKFEYAIKSPHRKNMEIAKSILSYVKTSIPFSQNNHLRGLTLTQDLNKEQFRSVEIEMYNRMHHIRVLTYSEPLCDNWKKTADLALRLRVGNCTELAALGFEYATEQLGAKNVEIFKISGGDHVFIVIGRNQNSKPEDYLNWGLSAIVVDLWAETYYPSWEIPNKLKDLLRVDNILGRYIPVLKIFDPIHQKLKPLVSSNFHRK